MNRRGYFQTLTGYSCNIIDISVLKIPDSLCVFVKLPFFVIPLTRHTVICIPSNCVIPLAGLCVHFRLLTRLKCLKVGQHTEDIEGVMLETSWLHPAKHLTNFMVGTGVPRSVLRHTSRIFCNSLVELKSPVLLQQVCLNEMFTYRSTRLQSTLVTHCLYFASVGFGRVLIYRSLNVSGYNNQSHSICAHNNMPQLYI